jgi:hypothetical protein
MFRSSLVLVAVLLLPISLASADIIYEFGQSNYNVSVGGTVDVEIFLSQNDPLGTDPINLSMDGLASAGLRVFFNDTPPTDPAAVLSLADIAPSALFDNMFVDATLDLVPGESAAFADSVDFFSPPIPGPRILLGTLRFTVQRQIKCAG